MTDAVKSRRQGSIKTGSRDREFRASMTVAVNLVYRAVEQR
jgi:hypothetical protein